MVCIIISCLQPCRVQCVIGEVLFTHCGIDLLVVASLAECSKADARALVREADDDVSGITKLVYALEVQPLLLTWPDRQLERKQRAL